MSRLDALAVEVPAPYTALLRLEAAESKRTIAEHLTHILMRRYDALRRVCKCGFFIYLDSDDLRCSSCGRECCPHCSVPESGDVCLNCRPGAQGGGFRR